MRVKFARVGLNSPEAARLLDGLRWEYETRYGPGDAADDVPAVEFDAPSGTFLVLLDGDTTVAGGGIRRFDETTCEIKRMWTHPDYRRQGHASSVLKNLVEIARTELGYSRLLLETGPAQPEALRMYRELGFREIGNYGQYENAHGFELVL